MRLRDLIEKLEETLRDLGDCEVHLMTQPHYPMEDGIHGVVTSAQLAEAEDDNSDEDGDEDSSADVVVYIVAGEQIGYGNKRAWDL